MGGWGGGKKLFDFGELDFCDDKDSVGDIWGDFDLSLKGLELCLNLVNGMLRVLFCLGLIFLGEVGGGGDGVVRIVIGRDFFCCLLRMGLEFVLLLVRVINCRFFFWIYLMMFLYDVINILFMLWRMIRWLFWMYISWLGFLVI